MTDATDATAGLRWFLRELEAGKTRAEIHADPLAPSRGEINRALKAHDWFRDDFEDAQMAGLQKVADDLLAIADDSSRDWTVDARGNPVVDRECIERTRIRIETRKWLLEKLARAVYGQKVEVKAEHSGGITVSMAPGDEKL